MKGDYYEKTLLAGSSLVLLLSSGFAFSSTTQAAENKEGNSPAVSTTRMYQKKIEQLILVHYLNKI